MSNISLITLFYNYEVEVEDKVKDYDRTKTHAVPVISDENYLFSQ